VFPKKITAALAGAFLVTMTACSAPSSTGSSSPTPGSWAPVEVDSWAGLPMDSARSVASYEPIGKASKPWNICVSVPHMKDAYWLGFDYGVVEQAREAGVNMTMVEAGGYENLSTQIQQIEDCSKSADAVVIGAISQDGLNSTIDQLAAAGKPVIDAVNGVTSTKVTARSLVSFQELAVMSAKWVIDDSKGEPVKVAWFPGPSGAGWSEAGNKGFQDTLKGTKVQIVDTKFGDTGKDAQTTLIEDALAANPDLDYIIGTAVTAEAAGSVLKDKGLSDKIKVAGYYFTPGTLAGLQDGSIAAAPTDGTVLQGRIAIDQAVRALDKKDFMIHVGPKLQMVTTDNVGSFNRSTTLAPDDWTPVFSVKAGE
jgi:protein TorT